MDARAMAALPEEQRLMKLDGTTPPQVPKILKKASQDRAAQVLLKMNYQEEAGRMEAQGLQLVGMQAYGCQACMTTHLGLPSVTMADVPLPDSYKAKADFLLVKDKKSGVNYAVEGSWQNDGKTVKFLPARVVDLSHEKPVAKPAGQKDGMELTAANLRALLTPPEVEVLAGKRGDQPQVGQPVNLPAAYKPKADYMVVRDKKSNELVVLEGKWSAPDAKGGSFTVSRRVNISKEPSEAVALKKEMPIRTNGAQNKLEDLSQIRAILDMKNDDVQKVSLAASGGMRVDQVMLAVTPGAAGMMQGGEEAKRAAAQTTPAKLTGGNDGGRGGAPAA